jgi:hypothetical protein
MKPVEDWKIVQAVNDVKNFIKFKKNITAEMKLANSEFNTLKLKRNWFGNVLYVQLNFTENDLRLVDYDGEVLMQNSLKKYITYLSTTLGWGEYLGIQINNFVDDDGNATLSYGVLFYFIPYVISAKWTIKWLLIVAAIVVGLIFLLPLI